MGSTRSFCQSPPRAAGPLTVAILCLLLLPVAGSGHHSRAEFSEQVEEIQGEIVSSRWSNPHPMIMLRAVRDDGEEETLQIQVYGAANNLSQAGVTDELFEVGDRIMIVGRRSTLRPGLVLGTHMFLADGRQAILARTLEPYRPGEVVGGLDAFIEAASRLADAVSENRGFFRVWSIEPGRGGEGVTQHRPLTEAAKAAQAEFNQEESRTGSGEAPGMPAFMHTRNHFELIDQGDTIRYEQPVFGVVRTIYLNPAGNAADEPHSPIGYSNRPTGRKHSRRGNNKAKLALSKSLGYPAERRRAHCGAVHPERRSGPPRLPHDDHRPGQFHRAGDLLATLGRAGESAAGGKVYAGLAGESHHAAAAAHDDPLVATVVVRQDSSASTRCASTVSIRLTYMKKPVSLP